MDASTLHPECTLGRQTPVCRQLGHEAAFRADQGLRTRHGHRRLGNVVLSASLSGGRQWPTTVCCGHLSQMDTPLYTFGRGAPFFFHPCAHPSRASALEVPRSPLHPPLESSGPAPHRIDPVQPRPKPCRSPHPRPPPLETAIADRPSRHHLPADGRFVHLVASGSKSSSAAPPRLPPG